MAHELPRARSRTTCAARPWRLAEFGRLAGEIAAHAGAAIDHWEILNEPDGDWAFEGSPEEYARMLVAAGRESRRARPRTGSCSAGS